jgi:hypothetical protein
MHRGLLDACGHPAEALDFVESVSKNENMMFLKKQQYEESVVPWYLISPHSKFRLRWDLCSVLLISCTPALDAGGTSSRITQSDATCCHRSSDNAVIVPVRLVDSAP